MHPTTVQAYALDPEVLLGESHWWVSPMASGGDAGPSNTQQRQTQADRRKLRMGYRMLKDRATSETALRLIPHMGSCHSFRFGA